MKEYSIVKEILMIIFRKGVFKLRLKAFDTIAWGNAPSVDKDNIYHTEGVRPLNYPKLYQAYSLNISLALLLGVVPQVLKFQAFSLFEMQILRVK